MTLALLMVLQAGMGPPDPRTDPRLDTGRLRAEPKCEKGEAEEILVCARREAQSPYRLPRLAALPESALPRAETSLFGGAAKGSIDAESAAIGPGVVSQRLMLTIKTPF